MTVALHAELNRVDVTALSARRAEVAALLRFTDAIHLLNGHLTITATLNHPHTAARLRTALHTLYGHHTLITQTASRGPRGATRFLLSVPAPHAAALARRTGLLDTHAHPLRGLPAPVILGGPAEAAALWRGAVLAAGTLTAPRQHPTLTIPCPTPETALALRGAARRLDLPAAARETNGHHVVIVRDDDTLTTLLTLLGAPRTARHCAQLWASRPARPTHRPTRFDDANHQRAQHAAAATVTHIEGALHVLGDTVPEHLAAAAALRLTHPHLPLTQLAQLADPPLTKDALAGRLRRLLTIADRHPHHGDTPAT